MSRLERILSLVILCVWPMLLLWEYLNLWTWRGWLKFGVGLFLLLVYAFGTVNYLRILLRNQRHIRILPFPFPSPEAWPELPELLNDMQENAEALADDLDTTYVIDVQLPRL